jgi:hypothetical protein
MQYKTHKTNKILTLKSTIIIVFKVDKFKIMNMHTYDLKLNACLCLILQSYFNNYYNILVKNQA